MQFEAKIIEDSISPAGVRLTTLQLCYPRLVHSELMTHRVLSRNASSSRAIPVAKMIEQVRNNPAMPVHWGKNQAGMQAGEELSPMAKEGVKQLWLQAAKDAASTAQVMSDMGLHKQVANRILEPFQWIHVIVTATEWSNFFALRDHPDADPNIQLLAQVMAKAHNDSKPVYRDSRGYYEHAWHLPYVTARERELYPNELGVRHLCKLSAARCARVSYLTHDGDVPDPAKDLALYERLVGSRPMHASPIEHQAMVWEHADSSRDFSGNFRGWTQFRKIIEAEMPEMV